MDRLFEWQGSKDSPIREALDRQKPHVVTEFEQRLQQSILNLNEQGLNVALYWKNPDPRKYVNIVPTSAISGEGIPDMLQLLVKLTQVTYPVLAVSSSPFCEHPGLVHMRMLCPWWSEAMRRLLFCCQPPCSEKCKLFCAFNRLIQVFIY